MHENLVPRAYVVDGDAGHRVHRKSNPLTLKVKPLPKDASGLDVGKWRISAEASQTTVAVGTPLQVRVSIEGTGNVKNAQLPKLARSLGSAKSEFERGLRAPTSTDPNDTKD